MPTLQGVSRHESGESYSSTFGTPTIVTTPSLLYQGRLNSLAIDAPGNEGVRKDYSGSPVRAYAGFPLRLTAAPAGGDTRVLTISSLADLAECFVYVNGSAQLYLNVGASFSVDSD